MSPDKIISDYWNSCNNSPHCKVGKVHLAIVDSHTATLILEGKKLIETRFSQKRHVPFEKIHAGDAILIKESGGPIVGTARVGRVRFYSSLNIDDIRQLKEHYNDFIQAGNLFWRRKKKSKYATFIYLEEVRRTQPATLRKKDRRGWVVYDELPELEVLEG